MGGCVEVEPGMAPDEGDHYLQTTLVFKVADAHTGEELRIYMPEIRHRVVGRVMRALSLLYRYDLGGDLRTAVVFQIDGPGGGTWHVDITPEGTTSQEGETEQPGLILHMRKTDLFCRMFTGRLNLPLVLLTGQLKLRGNLRLFPRFGSLFSVDTRS